MSTLDASTLADLREKAYLLLRLGSDSTAISVDALSVYYDDVGPAVSASVKKTGDTLTITDSVAGATAIDLTAGATDTLDEVSTAIDAVANWVPQVLTDPDATATDLQNLASKNALGAANITTLRIIDSELIDLLIVNIWAGIETGLRRDILSTSYSELYGWSCGGVITLEQPDVTAVGGVFTQTTNGLTVKYTGAATHARVEVTDTSVVLTSRVGATTTTDTTLFSASATTTAMASTLNAVAGWTASVVTDGPSAYLIRTPAMDAKDTERTLEAWTDTDLDYWTDYAPGLLHFDTFPSWSITPGGQIRVDYTAGFSSIPADVEQCLLEAVKASWEQTTQTAGLKSEKIGDYAYEVLADSDVQRAVAGAAQNAAMKLFTTYARMLP